MIHKNNTNSNFFQAVYLRTSCIVILLILMTAVDSQSNRWEFINLDMQSSGGETQLSMDQINVAGYSLENVTYNCPETLKIYPRHQCNDADLALSLNGQSYEMNLSSVFNFSNNYWEAHLSSLDNQIAVSTNSLSGDLFISLQHIVVNDFFKNPASWLNQVSGELSGDLIANIDALSLATKDTLVFQGFNYEQSDDVVFLDLGGNITFMVDVANQKLNAQIEISGGEMLVNELYVDYNSFPVTIDVTAYLNDDFDYVIDGSIINQQSMQLDAKVLLNQQFDWNLPQLKLLVKDSHYFNQQILDSMLGIYGFGNTQMSGGFELILNLDKGNFQDGHLSFNDYFALNNKRKIQVNALNGIVHWDWLNTSANSKLDWQELLLAGMPVNAGQASFNVTKNQFSLLGEHEFSVFDGSIIIKELMADELFTPSTNMTMNASILPISLKLISEKLNWPTMSGTISGEIPGMIKRGSVIEFLGALRLSVFQGEMLVENLSLERLFGVAPVIAADVTFQGFDLALLTETFGFGQITGKLAGNINELRITNWKTDRMDAHVYTVKTKGTKQTISQRAIDNISSLGGIKGAISKTFLRFFEDFSYQRIELSCKLHNSVCEIGGMKNQDNQFVIVEGGGIPKINIVGFVRTINWEEFISRLLNANYDN